MGPMPVISLESEQSLIRYYYYRSCFPLLTTILVMTTKNVVVVAVSDLMLCSSVGSRLFRAVRLWWGIYDMTRKLVFWFMAFLWHMADCHGGVGEIEVD